MSLKKGKCDCWRKTGECSADDITARDCRAKNKDGYCLSIIVDTDPSEYDRDKDFEEAMPEFCREMRFGN